MIEILISSTVLILILCGIRTFWKGKINLHLQYALWLLVVIRLIPFGLFMESTIPKIESPISIMSPMNYLTTTLIPSDAKDQSNIGISESIPSNYSNEVDKNAVHSGNTISNTSTSSLLVTKTNEVHLDLTLLKTIASTVWYLGMFLSTIWILYVNIRFQNTIKKDRKLLNNVTSKLPVYVSSSIHSPMLFMVNGKYGIYVTNACVEDEAKMKHALTHELCHFRHRDYLWSFLRCILLITYWFHPFVWLAAILSKRDCELSCDAAALKILGDDERFPYGRTILEFVSVHNDRGDILHVASGMSESKSGIKERIQQITKKSNMMLRTVLSIIAIVVVTIIITFTTAPKTAEGFSLSNETDITKEDSSISSQGVSTDQEDSTVIQEHSTKKQENTTKEQEKSSSSDLSKLLEDQIQGFDTGYYFNGDQFMTPAGPITSMSDFTDEMIVNKYYGKSVKGEVDSELDDGFSKRFRNLDGVSYWLTMDASKETTITIDYKTTSTITTLKALVVLPDQSTLELKMNEKNEITLPEGISEIVIVALDAAGEVSVSFINLTDVVNIQKTS